MTPASSNWVRITNNSLFVCEGIDKICSEHKRYHLIPKICWKSDSLEIQSKLDGVLNIHVWVAKWYICRILKTLIVGTIVKCLNLSKWNDRILVQITLERGIITYCNRLTHQGNRICFISLPTGYTV